MAKVLLIGVELADNLSLRYLTPILRQRRHIVKIADFSSRDKIPEIIKTIKKYKPNLIGLSMIYNLRGKDFCELANEIRNCGFRGHITGGGFFAHFNTHQILKDFPSIDSIIHGEGEYALADLADNLNNPEKVKGLSLRYRGKIVDTPRRKPIIDLDSLPFPDHEPRTYLNIPEINILSSRGCYANCHFCSIQAWLKDCGIPRFRQRSVSNIADEMAMLFEKYGIKLYYFMDDNFLMPNSRQNTRRLKALQCELRKRGLNDIAIGIKCRPDCVDKNVFDLLMEMGLIRVFIGIESFSQKALDFLGRRINVEQNVKALEILRTLDIHVTYNVLLFNPETTMDEILDNIRYLEKFMDVPMNFCRTEVYPGTPLEKYLRENNKLLGDYFSYDYIIEEPSVECLFKILAYAFDGRNFGERRVHELGMQIDYGIRIMKRFYPETISPPLLRNVDQFVRKLNDNTIFHLKEAIEFFNVKSSPCKKDVYKFSNELKQSVEEDNKHLWSEGIKLWNEMVKIADKLKRRQRIQQRIGGWAGIHKKVGEWIINLLGEQGFESFLPVTNLLTASQSSDARDLIYLSDYAPKWQTPWHGVPKDDYLGPSLPGLEKPETIVIYDDKQIARQLIGNLNVSRGKTLLEFLQTSITLKEYLKKRRSTDFRLLKKETISVVLIQSREADAVWIRLQPFGQMRFSWVVSKDWGYECFKSFITSGGTFLAFYSIISMSILSNLYITFVRGVLPMPAYYDQTLMLEVGNLPGSLHELIITLTFKKPASKSTFEKQEIVQEKTNVAESLSARKLPVRQKTTKKSEETINKNSIVIALIVLLLSLLATFFLLVK